MNLSNQIRGFFNKPGSIYSILVLAFVVRVIFFFISQLYIDANILDEHFVGSDSKGYHVLALDILETKSFDAFGAFRTPGYPVFIAGIYYLFGVKPWIVILFQILLELISIYLVYLIAKQFFNIKIAILAAIIFSIDPHNILFSGTLQSDTLFVTVFLLAIYYFIRSTENPKLINFLLTGFVLGLATLIRPISQFFPLILIFLALIFVKANAILKIKGSLLLTIGFIIALSPWLFRNYRQYNEIALTSIQGVNLLFYSAAYTEVAKTGKDIEIVREEFSKIAAELGANEVYNPVRKLTHEEFINNGKNMLRDKHNPFQNAKIYNQIASDYIKNNLGSYSIRHFKGILNMYLGLESRGFSNRLGFDTRTFKFDYFASPGIVDMIIQFFKSKPIGSLTIGVMVGVFLLVNYLAFICGAVIMFLEKRHYHLLIILSIIGYFSVLVGVVGLSRYKLPIIPFYVIAGAYGIFYLYTYIKAKRKSKKQVLA